MYGHPDVSAQNAELREASAFAERGQLDGAWRIVDRIMIENPNEVAAITLATQIARKRRQNTVAYHLAKAGVREAPALSAAWLNLGCACADLYQREEAEYAYEKCAELMRANATSKQRAMLMMNRSAMHLDYGEWDQAERYAREALLLDPCSQKSMGNLGIALLAQRQWSEGWRYYSAIGHEHRHRFQYGDAKPWDGKPAHRVVFNGEQGLGDEICFASMLLDAMRLVEHPIIDCDKRLQGLFARSFPQAKVYGTRWDKELAWDEADQDVQASTSFGELGQFFRRTDEDFDQPPYLIADLERVHMWQSLWNGRPAIGIAWTGGATWTGARFRRLSLEELLPVFQSRPDTIWVSLQYKDATDEITAFHAKHPDIFIRQYKYATLTEDYDDTAALVASLECVISVPTAVVHLANGLGVPCFAMKAPYSCWKFSSEAFFGPTTSFIENTEGYGQSIQQVAAKLKEWPDGWRSTDGRALPC